MNINDTRALQRVHTLALAALAAVSGPPPGAQSTPQGRPLDAAELALFRHPTPCLVAAVNRVLLRLGPPAAAGGCRRAGATPRPSTARLIPRETPCG